MYNNNSIQNQRGSVVITIVLFMIILMTSSAVVLSGTLTRHIRASQDYLSSEKAFAGANSGIEQMLYQVLKASPESSVEELEAPAIEYETGAQVEIKGSGCSNKGDNDKIVAHLTASGTYGNLVRRIDVGGGEGECNE